METTEIFLAVGALLAGLLVMFTTGAGVKRIDGARTATRRGRNPRHLHQQNEGKYYDVD